MTGCALLILSTGRADQGKSKSEIAELVQAARKALQKTQDLYQTGRATDEDIHRWSQRLMAAELKGEPNNRRPAADHLHRMKDLQDRVLLRAKAGVQGGEESVVAAVAYFVEEAKAE